VVDPPACVPDGFGEWGAIAEVGAGADRAFEYSPLALQRTELERWALGREALARASGVPCRVSFWTMRRYCVTRIVRDRDLAARMVLELGDVWRRVLAYRDSQALYDAELAPLLAPPACPEPGAEPDSVANPDPDAPCIVLPDAD
jgi:hypothetical protein